MSSAKEDQHLLTEKGELHAHVPYFLSPAYELKCTEFHPESQQISLVRQNLFYPQSMLPVSQTST